MCFQLEVHTDILIHQSSSIVVQIIVILINFQTLFTLSLIELVFSFKDGIQATDIATTDGYSVKVCSYLVTQNNALTSCYML